MPFVVAQAAPVRQRRPVDEVAGTRIHQAQHRLVRQRPLRGHRDRRARAQGPQGREGRALHDFAGVAAGLSASASRQGSSRRWSRPARRSSHRAAACASRKWDFSRTAKCASHRPRATSKAARAASKADIYLGGPLTVAAAAVAGEIVNPEGDARWALISITFARPRVEVRRFDRDRRDQSVLPLSDDGGAQAAHAWKRIGRSFPKEVKPGDILVAGRNFGCGSSRPGLVLREVGIVAIVVESVARLFLRNSIARAIPIFMAPGITGIVDDGETLEVDYPKGVVRNVRRARASAAQVPAADRANLQCWRAAGVRAGALHAGSGDRGRPVPEVTATRRIYGKH